jgi:hypothetical protein
MEQEEMATARMIAVITGREGRGEAIFFKWWYCVDFGARIQVVGMVWLPV